MRYEEAKEKCHVRSGIYRLGDPDKTVYVKNYPVDLDQRVPEKDKYETDWEEFDPREQLDSSAFDEMPA